MQALAPGNRREEEPISPQRQTHQRYEILERIDVGGMAEVFRAKSISMEGFERLVAIKRIHPNLVENQTFLQMFLDEARLSLSLVHANIVQVFDLGRSGDTYFIVMEYVDGTNLKTLLKSFRQRDLAVPVPQASYVVSEICKGLAYAHQKRDLEGHHEGIVHRDVSPPNILLSIEGEVKITDFGLAKAKSQVETTDPGVVKGKFGYLSPEAAFGHEVDVQADVFACGIVLWEMLAGRRLFQAKTDLDTLEMVRRTAVPSLVSVNPDVPDELERICMRALARDKAKRYTNAREFGRDLSEFLFTQKAQVTAYDISTLVRQVLRFTRIQGFSRSRTRVNALVQQEVDRLIELEMDTDRPSAVDLPMAQLDGGGENRATGDNPSVTVMEDPRTWSGMVDFGDDFELGEFADGDGGLTTVGMPSPVMEETALDSGEETDAAAASETPVSTVAPEPIDPIQVMATETIQQPDPVPMPRTDIDIFENVSAKQDSVVSGSKSATVVAPMVTGGAKAVVIGALAVILVLGVLLFYVLLTA